MSGVSPGVRVLVVTGTDTGVGKTLVTAALGRALRGLGVDVVAAKPVESGVETSELEDGVILAEATGQSAPRRALDRLLAPLAPPEAAHREGVELDAERWVTALRSLAIDHELVLVEGAGSLLSPLTWQSSLLDLAASLEAAVLVVGVDRLGTLGHTLLTVHALRAEGRPVAGIVLTTPQVPDESTGRNATALTRIDPSLRVLVLPRVAHWTEATEHLIPLARELRT